MCQFLEIKAVFMSFEDRLDSVIEKYYSQDSKLTAVGVGLTNFIIDNFKPHAVVIAQSILFRESLDSPDQYMWHSGDDVGKKMEVFIYEVDDE